MLIILAIIIMLAASVIAVGAGTIAENWDTVYAGVALAVVSLSSALVYWAYLYTLP